ncbi:MAG: hypothetical protein Q7Q71_12845 [Verrucomicrobiota bacterium JB023]|nr:hypothetical protein [Verrucomicrobiota bacterium JB023]
MTVRPQSDSFPLRRSRSGFAMLVAIMMSALLSLIAIGLLTLSTVEVRSAALNDNQAEARGNARLALMLAIGELQRFMGPDQRVCAPGSILDDETMATHQHWLGVWRTTKDDGSSWYFRDENGGLQDGRLEANWQAGEAALTYLVSGNEGGRAARGALLSEPTDAVSSSMVTVVGEGSVMPDRFASDSVRVPLVPVNSEEGAGRFGYWVGDLNARANVAVVNAYEDKKPSPEDPADGGYYRLMASQEVDETLLGNETAPHWLADEKSRMVTGKSIELLAGEDWFKPLFHDVTHYSRGVLADVRDGGLKKDLSAYLLGDSSGEEGGSTIDLKDLDPLVGWDFSKERSEQNNPFAETAPRFGILKDWVNSAGDFKEEQRAAEAPLVETDPVLITGSRMAFANNQPTALTGRLETDLVPVLVEGSMYSTISYHPNPPGFAKKYNIRTHMWPRVVLWNPYDVDITIPQSVMMMQLNTRNDFHTTIEYFPGLRGKAQWISWGGGTRSSPPKPFESIIDSDNYNDPYTGMYYFMLPEETLGAGECYVFSPDNAREYHSGDVTNNLLTAEKAPDPSRNFYISSSEFDEDDTGSGFNYKLINYWYAPPTWLSREINNQADDSRMIWKDATEVDSLSIYEFDDLPQLALVSCSLQYGAGKEPRVAWSENKVMTVEETDLEDPVLETAPDVRTREGFRLRWFQEHLSNEGVVEGMGGSGGLGVLETAPLANWNPRAAYAIRTPWENVGGDKGDGTASGPWLFGNYTRDLYDEETLGWTAQQPQLIDGKYRGNPFGTPQDPDFREKNILFAVPREETGVLSLAQFQHTKLTDFSWHPAYAVGNSLCDPRLGREGMASTVPAPAETAHFGWSPAAIGWSNDSDRSATDDEWARFGRAILQDWPEEEPLVYDLSFEVNHTLWDHFFLSSGDAEERKELVESGTPLPNGRFITTSGATEEKVTDYDEAASSLYLEGAFNVNSTSVEAWKALLASTRGLDDELPEGSLFPRFLNAPGGNWLGEDWADEEVAWTGTRLLTEPEVEALAEAIVEEVRLRGPFLSLSDFVNRRLRPDETGEKGALQAAIDKAGLNAAFSSSYPLDKELAVKDYSHPDNIEDATLIEQDLKPESKAWGATTFLTQADVLQVLGPVLTARSDSFVVRAYGDSVDKTGKVIAQAWCEAVIQRTPEPLATNEGGSDSDVPTADSRWGRRLKVVSFRWLNATEV